MSSSETQQRPDAASPSAPTADRVRASSELAPLEQTHLIEQLPLAVYRLDAKTPYNLNFAGGALEDIVGWKPDEWIAAPQNWKTAIHEEDRPRSLRKIAFALQSGSPQEWQHRYVHRNGKTIWVKHRIQAISSGGEAVLIGTLEDVTAERMMAAKNLTGAHVPSAQAQGLSRLAGGIAHEFNNALTSILGNAQLMLREFAEEDPSRKSALEIISAGERAAELTQELLSFSRMKKQPSAAININDLLESMASIIQAQLGPDQQLRLELASAPIMISGHSDQLEKMIVRLAENSRDAMPPEGSLTIETHCVMPGSKETLPPDCPSNKMLACITVTDTGSGISDKDRPFIFDPFYSTRDDPKYRGLGLSLALYTIEQHQGFVAMDSNPESGTAVRIYLPWHENGKASTHSAPTEIPTGTETILLVEDDPSVRATTEKILKSLNYTVHVPRDATEAIQLVQRLPGMFDLALLDIYMPDIDGFTLGQQLKTIKPDLETLYISGYAQEALPADDPHCDNSNFISKPYTREKLARALRRTLDEAES